MYRVCSACRDVISQLSISEMKLAGRHRVRITSDIEEQKEHDDANFINISVRRCQEMPRLCIKHLQFKYCATFRGSSSFVYIFYSLLLLEELRTLLISLPVT